jgi:glycerol-1-phosphate dehydrogenase [NAD(P)+]
LGNSYQLETKAGIETLLSSIIMSGLAMCIAGSSRPSSGAEHQFAQALDKITKNDALHGEKCGVGTIMMLYLHGGNEYKLVKRTLKRIGAPTTAKELGIPKDKIIEALAIAHKVRGRYTILGDKGLSYKKAFELAKITGIIDE